MLNAEYVRVLNCNYEKIGLTDNPDTKRYQYCILGRGGIKGLLHCDLHIIDHETFLYYDISSKQNMAALYKGKKVNREWVKEFLISIKCVQAELTRFLLDDRDVLWFPDQIFQDLEQKTYFFLYIPYYDQDTGFLKLVEFFIEHIDYDDSVLVDFVYQIYNQYEKLGSLYLEEQIFEDAKSLEQMQTNQKENETKLEDASIGIPDSSEENENNKWQQQVGNRMERTEKEKKSKGKLISILLDSRKKKFREQTKNLFETGVNYQNYAVCEESSNVEEDYGRTLYIDESSFSGTTHILYDKDNGKIFTIEKESVTIGKIQDDADLFLTDASISRIHAKIFQESSKWYLEDQNSTNGTYKNGIRLNPYEKKELISGDEIKCGNRIYLFR
jgi:hypothetical protein